MEYTLQDGDEVICRINGKKERGYLSLVGNSLFFENTNTPSVEIYADDICFVWVSEEWKEFLLYELTNDGFMAILEEY